MPYVQGFLNIVSGGSPDNSLPGMPVGPDNSLPGSGAGIDNSLPKPPPGVWPPPSAAHPIVPAPPGTPPGVIWPPIGHPPSWGGGWGGGGHPDQGLPGGGGRPARPDQGLPGGGGRPARPDQGLPGQRPPHASGQPVPGGGQPDNTLPGQPAHPDQGLPSGKFWVVAGIPGVGWRYVCVDPSQQPDQGLPPEGGTTPPPTPDQGLPPTPPRLPVSHCRRRLSQSQPNAPITFRSEGAEGGSLSRGVSATARERGLPRSSSNMCPSQPGFDAPYDMLGDAKVPTDQLRGSPPPALECGW